MDGWTDKYTRSPYCAVRISVIHEWTFKVLTLALEPVKGHTSQSLCRFMKGVLSEFYPDYRNVLLFNTTDSASNMKLLSTLLRHERVDCTAHCLHLLLTVDVDGLSKVPELNVLLQKCKDVVRALHFKGHVIQLIEDITADMEMFERIQNIIQILDADDYNPIAENVNEETEQLETEIRPCTATTERRHQSLKNSVCTRWNSVLLWWNLLLTCFNPENEALKKIGKFDQCFDQEDLGLLKELRSFLVNFKDMTLLVSEWNPNL